MRRNSASLFVVGLVVALQAPAPGHLSAQSNQGPPAPMPLQVRVMPAPGGPVVTWQQQPNVASYTVRRWKQTGSQSRCCEREARSLSRARYVDSLAIEGIYIYRVIAHFRDGRRGFQERTIQVNATPVGSAQAENPPENTIVRPLPDDIARRAPPGGRVITASPDPASTIGTANEPAPSAAPSTDPQHAAPQPANEPATPPPVVVDMPNRERRPTPVFTAVNTGGSSEPAPPPAPPAAVSGRYLVSVVGLRTGRTTKDGIGIVDVDGKGDEIMAAAFVRRFSRATAEALEYTNLQTMVYGDIQGYQRERVQAGRLTSTGGITDGDPIPLDGPAARTMPAQTSVFPWRLWEGSLTDGADALVISPSIWEYDGNPQDFFPWVENQQALTRSIFLSARLQEQIDKQLFGPLILGANESATNRFDATARFLLEGGIAAVMGLPPLGSILGRQRDRPIGMVARDQNTTALPNTTVVLTREIIEAALARPAAGVWNPLPSILVPLVKPGIMVIDFQDKTVTSTNTPFDGFFDRAAFYSMIIQVERIP